MKKVITICIVAFTISSSANANTTTPTDIASLHETITYSQDINPELQEMLKSGVIESLTISYNEDLSCTLSAEVSYKGASLKLSITADTCEEAGAGLAQATRGFMKETDAL
uniref:hypothetical protein n=1 Tax=uncultured Christiangramia sp. TaxID=503836 RepID=UPI00260A3ABA|nr:hypothetical protein [uncultured Christiangramia sp.]